MSALIASSERLPTWARAASIIVLPVLAFATNASLGTPALPPLFAAFLALSVFALWAHLPVVFFDGPLPFSDAGVHVRDRVLPWASVERIEPLGERDLQAVLTDGQTARIRVRAGRSRDDLREALARHKPEAVAF